MSTAGARESEQATPAWKIRNSLWVFMCVGTFGLAAPWIILYKGLTSRRPVWMAVGSGLAAASITSIRWLSGDIWQREAADWLLMAVWLGGSTFAAGANQEYLRIKWAARKDTRAAVPTAAPTAARRARGGAARAARTGSPAATRRRAPKPQAVIPATRQRGAHHVPGGVSASVPGSVPGTASGPRPGRTWTSRATDTGGRSPAPDPGSAPALAHAPAPSPAHTPVMAGSSADTDMVEINGASAEAFAALPGFDADLAVRAVSLRQGRPYVSVEQFAERLALQPHVFMRIRNRLSCRSTSVPPGFGRRVDY